MSYLDVNDLSFEELSSTEYDLSIFACGYEERSIFFPGLFSSSSSKVIVFGFSDSAENSDYKLNSAFYLHSSRYKVDPIVLEYRDVNKLFTTLLDAVENSVVDPADSFKVLVDYSSMPRLWYSEILNFIKSYDFGVPVVCDFVYSVGEHVKAYSGSQLSDPIVLPGCGGISTYNKETVGIFSLGFNEGGPICLHRKIEPDKTFSLIARPGALEDYTEKAIQCNKVFLESCSMGTVYAPIDSVERSYSILREMFYPYLQVASVVMVPFGPKPHALASILAAMNYPEVACLYSSMGGSGAAVKPTTELVISRITKLKASPYYGF